MFLKTKLVVLGMLLALMTLLSIGTHQLLGDENGGKKKCPDKIFVKIQCPLAGAPSCKGMPEPACKFNNPESAEFSVNRFPHPIPEFQDFEFAKGHKPVSPPKQKVCYTVYGCFADYKNVAGKFVFWECSVDRSDMRREILAPVFEGSLCPE